jgi:hypothetical protein
MQSGVGVAVLCCEVLIGQFFLSDFESFLGLTFNRGEFPPLPKIQLTENSVVNSTRSTDN